MWIGAPLFARTEAEDEVMRKRKAWIVSLFLLGFLIMIYPHLAQPVNKEIQRWRASDFHRKMEGLPAEKKLEKVEAAEKCNEAIFKNEDNLHDPFTEEFNKDDFEACVDVEFEEGQFASLEIPDLDLVIPIYLGATPSILAKGVGQVEGSSIPIGGESSHTVLAGHRGMATKAMFRNLNELTAGDMIYIQTMNEKLTYEIYEVEVILPHETENLVVAEGKDLASLITCHPYRDNSHRLVVHAERVN